MYECYAIKDKSCLIFKVIAVNQLNGKQLSLICNENQSFYCLNKNNWCSMYPSHVMIQFCVLIKKHKI